MSEKGVIVAGGLHPDHAKEYFRIGHVCLFLI
jgi:aspartate aminotransferase-like enzyme